MGYAVRMTLPLVQVPVGREAAWAFPAQARFALADEWLGRKALPRRCRAAGGAARPPLPRRLRPGERADVQAWSGLAALRETIETAPSPPPCFP